MIGKTVLGYNVDEKIGSGGFGTVYKVSKTNAAGTYVRALKHITLPTKKQYASVLNSMGGDYSKADDYFASILKDIVSEISILSTLSESGTQNIVRYYESDIIETPSPKTYDIYILMEYLTPFTDYIESNSFTVRDVIKLGKDILKALMSCHEKNIIHRDIKDDNIFVSADGSFKLGDFGVSKALKDKSRAESMKGTPNFIAPEVYLGKEKYDNTVDLYSLGIVLYKLLNKSRNPFLPKYPALYSSQDEETAFEARMAGNIPELPVLAENELGSVIVKAIMPRQDRYNSASEFYEALLRVEGSLDGELLATDLGLCVPQEVQSSTTMPLKATADKHNNETVGTDDIKKIEETVDNNATRNLFDTVGSAANGNGLNKVNNNNNNSYDNSYNISDNRNDGGSNNYGNNNYSNNNYSNNNYGNNNYGNGANYNNGWNNNSPFATPQSPKKSKKGCKWLLYLSPVIIAAVWLTVYMLLIPALYSKALSFIGWIIKNPSEIIDIFEDANNILIPMYQVIILKIYNWLTFAGIIATLFFIGRSIQNARPEQNARARLRGNEPYLITMSILEEIKLIGGANVEKARKAVYLLNERFKNESAFGEGNDSIIDCENEIASYLNSIQGLVSGLRNENTVEENANNIEILCQRSMSKLKMRIELKKR